MTVILSSDILIADVIVDLEGNRELQALAGQYGLKPGSKTAISEAQFKAFAAVAGEPIAVAPGGSSANVLVTLNKLCDLRLAIHFIGVAGNDAPGLMIRRSLEEAHIRLAPETLPPGVVARAATSYVLRLPDGNRIIATYPGNAGDILSPAMITEAAVQASDILFLQGSLWRKMGEAYAGRLLELAKRHRKEIWFALPTYAGLSGEQAELFRRLLADANLVFGNAEELATVFAAPPETALHQLQEILRKKGALAFITRAEQGAAVVSPSVIEYIPLAPAQPERIVGTLGAGDTAFAGFAFGRLRGFPAKDCAEIAMALAAEKLKVQSSRLADPKASLCKSFPGKFL